MPAATDGYADLVAELRGLRARILYDHGRRPEFRDSDGAHIDDQELDYGAWHFIARRDAGARPLGYVRLSTPDTAGLYQSRAYLGDADYARVLAEAGACDADTFEHSRLVVEHRARKLGLGVYLNAVAIGAAHHLGARLMIGTSGTRDGQDLFHARFGFHPVAGTQRYVERYTEDVVILTHHTAAGAGKYTELVASMRARFPELVVAHPGSLLSERASGPAPAITSRSGAVPDRTTWCPVLFEDDRNPAELCELLDSGVVHTVHDTIHDQLTELVKTREPHRRFTETELAEAISDQLAGVSPAVYGTWAWYPWSGRLVHVLPREEYRMVRTDRNREKIQRPEQRWLLNTRIGIVGLSVGNSAAVTLVLGGIGGSFRLADFDELSLSNLNRLRTGVHDLGVNKAVLCARQMFEIDPYLDIEIMPAGLGADTMAQFLGEDGSALDLLVEECDTPYVKIAAREGARAQGIPVVMDCNDRGMLDIERFDLEPNRPLLHGRIGNVRAEELPEMNAADKAELILGMVDADRISPELAAAFPEIGRTLSSWPQLAADVALGGALVADAARRILLGLPCESGRYYVDLAELIAPAHNTVELLAGVHS
ncbi:ThiF family adenylyltransferase [Nocardia jejuensis]|uniref:ThiF family adenylyltransferase n=1 Tax=Nocardia jejuensis TaxID=328049 RepID=UPI001C3FF438|nr:ThiF family adenylyltransferase [Nocardia jejuensis]